jgi:hypothetical protein
MLRFGESSALGYLPPSSSDGRSPGTGDWTLNRANRSSTAWQMHLRPFHTTLLYRVVDSDGASAFVSSHSRHRYFSIASTRRRSHRHEVVSVIDDKPLHGKPFTCGLNRNRCQTRGVFYKFYKLPLVRSTVCAQRHPQRSCTLLELCSTRDHPRAADRAASPRGAADRRRPPVRRRSLTDH